MLSVSLAARTSTFRNLYSQKVISLEAKKAEAERHLGYAKMIQLTGRFPSRPKEMGSVTFDAFHEKALEGWNVYSDPRAESAQFLVEQLLEQPEESWGESELGRMLQEVRPLSAPARYHPPVYQTQNH